MNTITKAILATCSLLLANQVSADSFEFVVKHKNNEITSAVKQLYNNNIKQKSFVIIDGQKTSNVIVEAKTHAEALLILKSSEKFEYIEPVVKMELPRLPVPVSNTRDPSISNASVTDDPNDTHFGDQREYLSAFSSGNNGWLDFKTGHGFVESWANMSSDTKLSRVGVADSGFAPHPDIRFSSESADFIDLDNDAMNETWMRDNPGCSPHGNGVSSGIAAVTNNGIGISGAANNVEVIPARVLNCGIGGTQFKDAIYWFSGVSYAEQGISDISKPVDVINLSLGGYVTGGCMTHVQEAIDHAVEQGIPVVVAAGNSTINVENHLPAGCDNVIVVGATDWINERTDFSNYGAGIDLTAQGVDILGAGLLDESDENYVLWWEGTSNAAPLVTAAIANVKSEVDGLSVDEIKYLLTSTTRNYAEGTSCTDTERSCGTGSLDADAFLEAAKLYSTGNLSFIKHALANNTECENTLFIEQLSADFNICQLYQITFHALAKTKAGISYSLYRVAKGSDLSVGVTGVELFIAEEANPSLYYPFTENDLGDFDYGFVTCTNGLCSTEIIPLTLDATKTAQCP
jgi:serine protease